MDDKKPNADDSPKADGQVEQSFEFKPIEYHEWRQEGNMLHCTSCRHPHGTPIKQGLILGKDSSGNFTLKSVEEEAKDREIQE